MTQEHKTKIGSQKAKIAKLKKKIADLKARPAAGKVEEPPQIRYESEALKAEIAGLAAESISQKEEIAKL